MRQNSLTTDFHIPQALVSDKEFQQLISNTYQELGKKIYLDVTTKIHLADEISNMSSLQNCLSLKMKVQRVLQIYNSLEYNHLDNSDLSPKLVNSMKQLYAETVKEGLEKGIRENLSKSGLNRFAIELMVRTNKELALYLLFVSTVTLAACITAAVSIKRLLKN